MAWIRKISRSKKGISLVETMVAILVFGIVLVTMLEVTVQSMTVGKRADLSYNAYSIAKNHIESLKTLPFADAANAAESEVRLNALGVPDLEGPFKRTTAVTANYSGDSNLVSITVSVDYMVKHTFTNKPVSLSTVIYQYA